MNLPYNPAGPTPSCTLRRTENTGVHTCTRRRTATVLVTDTEWERPKCHHLANGLKTGGLPAQGRITHEQENEALVIPATWTSNALHWIKAARWKDCSLQTVGPHLQGRSRKGTLLRSLRADHWLPGVGMGTEWIQKGTGVSLRHWNGSELECGDGCKVTIY